jgi:hypothetical protein
MRLTSTIIQKIRLGSPPWDCHGNPLFFFIYFQTFVSSVVPMTWQMFFGGNPADLALFRESLPLSVGDK